MEISHPKVRKLTWSRFGNNIAWAITGRALVFIAGLINLFNLGWLNMVEENSELFVAFGWWNSSVYANI